jgi:hypothetical protein
MKAYAISPAFDLYEEGVPIERTRAAISLIAEMTLKALRRGGDVFQFAVDWRDPGAPTEAPVFEVAEPHLIRLEAEGDLLRHLVQAVDPNARGGSSVRSAGTCRAATFGWDGQAFICLRYADPAPVSADETLAVVEEVSRLLTDTDYFDGWARPD